MGGEARGLVLGHLPSVQYDNNLQFLWIRLYCLNAVVSSCETKSNVRVLQQFQIKVDQQLLSSLRRQAWMFGAKSTSPC